MTYKAVKSTLAEANNGICGSRNNARYKGNTVVWLVMGDDGEWVDMYKRKSVAESVAEYANEIDYNGVGCLDSKYSNWLFDNDKEAWNKFIGLK